MNYVELWQAIQDYTENTETTFVSNIPRFVKEAEDRIYNAVQIPALRKNVTGNLTSANQYLSLPNDWLSNYSVAVIDSSGSYNYLINKDVNFIREAFPNSTVLGTPVYYGLFGSQINNINEMSLILGPTPDKNYSVELHYFYYPPTIVQGSITTIGAFSGGGLYTNGTYINVPLSGGSGIGATATITVVGTVVVGVTITNGGNFYVVGDTLSINPIYIGAGTGSGFSVPVTAISNAIGTSWLGDNYDPVLFYGALREAIIFMKGDADLVANYESKFQEGIAQLKRLGDGLDKQDSYRTGTYRVNVG